MSATPGASDSHPESAGAAPSGPARDLAGVWDLLDALPPATPRGDLAATTIDLIAAKVAATASAGERGRSRLPGRWIVPVAAVMASLTAGLVAGRATAPDPDRWVLERLPAIEHLDLLREAGSVGFLEAVAERLRDHSELPRWLRAGGDPRSRRQEAIEFDAALEKLEAEEAAGGQGRDVIQARRAAVAALPAAQRAELERDAETLRGLSSLDRRELVAVAAALTDPANERLRNAARTWHVILAGLNPVVRRTAIEMPTEERLELLERPLMRPRDDFRERRPNAAAGPERRPPSGAPPGFRFPPPPGAGPREAPAETRAPPR